MDGVQYAGHTYRSEEIAIPDVSTFDPDDLVYRLMKDFYASFGFEESAIPLFDEDHHFQP